jgi:hypothetical protein
MRGSEKDDGKGVKMLNSGVSASGKNQGGAE